MAKREERKPRIQNDGFDKVTVEIRRVAKVVKGGRTLRISALVVVGNKKGQIGYGLGKSIEANEAIEKATQQAKKNLITVPIVNDTIPHKVVGKYGATSLLMVPTKEGNGIIAGGAARVVLELSGIKNITAKKHGSNNKINVVKATFAGLQALRTADEVAQLRGKTVEEI